MLKIKIPGAKLYDEEKNLFIETRDTNLVLEHSLVSLSKWEEKWEKPFLANSRLSYEEAIDYVRCMTITQNVPQEVYANITTSILNEVGEYIARPMTATTFSETGPKPPKQVLTNELIYYSMVALNIPFECQKWHLNRLITLIKVCDIKNSPPKKRSRKEILTRNRALNEQRRKQLGTSG